jgi:hypothetical protein
VTALRRAAVSKALGGGLWALGALLLAWAGVTVGAQAVTGAPLPFVSQLLPMLVGAEAVVVLGVFILGAALACVLAYFLARITFELRQRMNAG